MKSFTSVMAVVAAVLCGTAVLAEPKVETTAIVDGFDTLRPDRWYLSDGWSNGAHQNCTWSKRALALAPDPALEVLFVPKDLWGEAAYCGEVQTKGWFRYGTFEARIRTDGGSGLNAAFFLYGGPVHGLPHGEIDFEILTYGDDKVWTNRFVDGDDFGEGALVPFDGDVSAFHDYAFIWEPDRIRWFIDGTLVREVTDHVPDHRLKAYFSHWGTDRLTDWMGRYDAPDGPVAMTVERFAYTPPGQDCAFPESILCTLR